MNGRPLADPAHLLVLSELRLRAKFKPTVCWFDHAGSSVQAHTEWGGVLVVTDRITGQELARSRPGYMGQQPTGQ